MVEVDAFFYAIWQKSDAIRWAYGYHNSLPHSLWYAMLKLLMNESKKK